MSLWWAAAGCRTSTWQAGGFINKEVDLMCLDKLGSDPAALARYSAVQIIEQGGSQGVEILNLIALWGALTAAGRVGPQLLYYHVPISNTASGLLVLRSDSMPAEMRKAG
jgi:protocatechuate 4,5-dioxygenase beta chain